MFWSIYLYQTLLLCKASLRTYWILFSGSPRGSWGDFWSFAFKGCYSFSSRDTDVHTVASLLKLYLRDLPEPVVPWSQYEGFLLCGQLMNADEAKVGISLELGVLLGKKVMVTEHYSGRQGTVVRGSIPIGEILCPTGTSLATKGKWSQSWWQPSWDVTTQ